MLFQRIESEGLAHYSYLVGDGEEAVVIDPRRDCDVYIDHATRAGFRISTILETHRNEDYIIGSRELAAQLGGVDGGVEIWHADTQMDYGYGRPVQDGQTWQIGRLVLKALHTPGHTPGHMSYLLHDPDGHPWVVFSGDALFAGDVGRVDLLGEDHLQEMAGMLYDTLVHTLLPLGDEIILCAAHGAGSVCGSAIAERVWTTIGLERKHNPRLQFDSREAFIKNTAQMLERPPYFRRAERLNVEGMPVLNHLPVPPPLKPDAFAKRAQEGVVLDTRMELSFGAAHVPGALSIWQGGLASFAGWYLPYDTPILLVTPTDDPSDAVRTLVRLGYTRIEGVLAGGMLSWLTAGRESSYVDTITTHELCRQLDAGEKHWILDVRSDDELAKEGEISGAHHIHVTLLPARLEEVPEGAEVHVFCGSGRRSMLAASYLQREGRAKAAVVVGGTEGWQSMTCPLKLLEKSEA